MHSIYVEIAPRGRNSDGFGRPAECRRIEQLINDAPCLSERERLEEGGRAGERASILKRYCVVAALSPRACISLFLVTDPSSSLFRS